MITKLRFAIGAIFSLAVANGLAQAPAISYGGLQTYLQGTAITPLTPTNTGGAVNPKTFVTSSSGYTGVNDLAVDASGNTYVADAAANEVIEFVVADGTKKIIGSGFNGPTGVAVDAAGNVYVADAGNNAIKEVPVGGGAIVTLGSGFSDPNGVTLDAAENIYLTDTGHNLVKEIKASDGSVVTVGSGLDVPTGIALSSPNDTRDIHDVYVANQGTNSIVIIYYGYHTPSNFTAPVGNASTLTIDAANNLYYIDKAAKAVYKNFPDGQVNTLGTGFSSPTTLALDGQNNVYIGDAGTGKVDKIYANGGYTVTPALPKGLNLNENTGVITGTPTVAGFATTYAITALNNSGSSTVNLTITINPDTKPAISYASPQTYTLPTPIAAISPVNAGGLVTSAYAISPALPGGLVFNTTTGVISGSSTTSSPSTNYSIIASNYSGIDTAVINITVNLVPLPTLSYTTPQVYHMNTAIAPLTPTSSGVAAPAYSPTLTAVVSGIFNGLLYANPQGLARDPSGNFYITDVQNELVREYPAGGGTPHTVYTNANDDTDVHGLAVDSLGNLYVTTDGVVKIPASGGPAEVIYNKDSAFNVVVDPAGNVYTDGMYKIPPGGGAPVLLGSTGSPGAVDALGNVYFTTNDYGKLFELPVGGTAKELAYSLPGLTGIAVDASSNVFVTLTSNNSIREYFNGGPSYITFTPAAHHIENIVVDAQDNLYVVDYSGSGFIQKITPVGGYYINKELPAGLTFNSSTGTISGTPTAASPATNYVITGYNTSGGTSTTINIEVLSNNAQLAGLALSTGTLSPAFSPTTTAYTADVDYVTTSVTVTPVTVANTSTVTVNGVAVASGSASTAIPLAVGPNIITTVVTAGDGTTTQTYTTTVTREVKSNNANLSSLSISTGTLSPAFSSTTNSYATTVNNAITSITVTPVTASNFATVTVNGSPVTSGTASASITLAVGANTVLVQVTAQDGTTVATDTITVTRQVPASNADLAAIGLSNGTLSPAFTGSITSYHINVGNTLTAMTVTPTTADIYATVTVNGAVVASGSQSPEIPLVLGTNSVNLTVTAQDGVTTKTYTLIVYRARSSDANLTGITLSSGAVSPVFVPAVTSYTAIVDNGVSSITVTPTVSASTSSVMVNGTSVTSGTASADIPLAVGVNTITSTVTAENGSTKTYTITVTRSSSVNVFLAALVASNGVLIPDFSPGSTTYNVYVGNLLSTMTLTPTTADPAATVTVNGTAVTSGTPSGYLPLTIGANICTVVVTGSDGTTTLTYTVIIHESESENNYLYSLTTSTGIAQGLTVPETITQDVYSDVSSVIVTPITRDGTASVTVNGKQVTSGDPSQSIPLFVGSNTITLVVTAQDTRTRTYTLNVNRAPAADNNAYQPAGVSVQNFGPRLADDGIIVHQGISPNGDGINDFLQIDNISRYPDNKIAIMNRNGQLVYELKGYDNANKVFDGHSNQTGQMQLPGTYFYELDYTVNGITKHKTGYLVLKY